MEGASKLFTEIVSQSSVSEFLGGDLLRASYTSTELPADTLGFWLTQGIPFGVFLLHLLSAILGERNMGRCFVNSPTSGDLPHSQQLYITEFCLDQAKDAGCGDVWPNWCTANVTQCDINPEVTLGQAKEPNHDGTSFIINSIFVYRYHLWFMFIFIIIRGLPRIVWKLFCKADIQGAIHGVAMVAEFQHAIQGVKLTYNKLKVPDWMEPMSNIGLDELELRVKRKVLFYLYTLRKLADILLDAFLLAVLIVVLNHHTSFKRLTFVCDLHHDTNNLLNCNTIKDRFVTCTLSFGMEFVLGIYTVVIVFALDLLLQGLSTVRFTKLLHRLIRKIQSQKDRGPLYLDSFLAKELELNARVHSEGNQGHYLKLMDSPNDLYLIGQLYRQSNVAHGHFLKMIAETMIEELRSVFEEKKRSPSQPQEIPGTPQPSAEEPLQIRKHLDDKNRGSKSSIDDSGEHSISTDNLLSLSGHDAPVIM